MLQLIMIVLIPLLLGIVYSYLVSRFSENRILLFLPAILGALWFIYIFTFYNPDQSPGLAGLAVIVYGLAILGIIAGNTMASLFFIFKKKKNSLT